MDNRRKKLALIVLIVAAISIVAIKQLNDGQIKSLSEAIDAYHRGMYEESLSFVDEMIEIFPSDPELYYWKAKNQIEMGDVENGVLSLNKAILFQPSNAVYLNERALIYMDTEEYSKAYRDYSKAILVSPNVPELYSNLGNCASIMGEDSIAIDVLNKGLIVDSEFGLLYYHRGIAYYNLRMYNQSIEDFKQSYMLDSNLISSHLFMGMCFTRMGDTISGCEKFNLAYNMGMTDALEYLIMYNCK